MRAGTACLAAALLALQACAMAPPSRESGAGQTGVAGELAERLAGEYTNHAQVWAARQEDGPVPPGYKLTIVPLDTGEPGTYVLHFRQYPAGESAVPAREARFLLAPGPEGGVVQHVERQTPEGWQALPGCSIHWHRTESGFEGATRGDACRFRDPKSGEAVTRYRNWTVNAEGIAWRERREVAGETTGTQTLRFVPVSWYTGWAGVRERGADGGGRGEWRIQRRMRLHDGGGVSELPGTAGAAHAIRLERLEWPRSGIRMLRLSVIEVASGELVAYAWAPPGADHIGIHLGWLQAGLERAAPGTPSTGGPPASP